MAEVFNWLSKNKLAVLDGECYSQQNQQCEINAAGEGVVRLGMQLADEKRNGNKRLLIIRAEGPAKNPD